jgi:hypothetical protein
VIHIRSGFVSSVFGANFDDSGGEGECALEAESLKPGLAASVYICLLE